MRLFRMFVAGVLWAVLTLAMVAQGAAAGAAAGATEGAAEGGSRGGTGHTWSSVQALPAGTTVHVKAGSRGGLCRVAGVEDDVLRCDGAKSYARAEVRRVTLSRRGASAAGLGALGAGVGALTTFGLSKGIGYDGQAKGVAWAAGLGIGAAIFTPIGFFGDPFRGPVVYSAQ